MNRYVKIGIGKLLIVCLLAGMLTGCGGAMKETETTGADVVTTQGETITEESTTEAPEETTEEDRCSLPVYDVEWQDVDFFINKVSSTATGEDVLYLYGRRSLYMGMEEEEWTEPMIISCDLDGRNPKVVFELPETPRPLELSEGETHTEMIFGQMSVDSEGNLIVRYKEYHHAYGQDKKTVFRIVKYDREGNELWSTRLPEETNSVHFVLAQDQIVCAIRPTGHGPMRVLIYDGNGQLLKDHDTGERLTLQLRYYGGKVYLYAPTDYMGDKKLREFDLEAGEFGKGYASDIQYDGEWVAYGGGYDLLARNQEGIWGYNLGEVHSVKVLDFELSGLEPRYENVLIPVGEHDFCLFVNENPPRFAKLTRRPAKEVEKKQLITVVNAIKSLDGGVLKDMHYRFNRENELYQVQVIDYDSIDALKQDIAAGEGPDVLILGEYTVNLLHEEVANGAFEDLYPWIDSDAELSREKLCSAALRAGEMDGKLYSLITSFWLASPLGKASVFGVNDGWTLEEMGKISDQYPNSKLFHGQYHLEAWIGNSGKLFLDEKTGMVNFYSETFVDMLELTKRAETIELNRGYGDKWFKDNEILLIDGRIES